MSPKKKEAAAPAGAQSAAERAAAEAELSALVAKFASANVRLVGALRRSLQERLPTSHEVVYEYRDCFVVSFSPDERGYEAALSIRGSADDVRLYFNRGKNLPDPADFLQGTANTRWVTVESASTLARPEVARLMDEAIARNRVPYARTGRGSVVVRSTAAKKRGQRRGA